MSGGRPVGSGLTAEYSTRLGFSFDSILGNNLSILKNAANNDDLDLVGLLSGDEGSGKTEFATQLAVFLDKKGTPTLPLRQYVFTPEQFSEAIDTFERGEVIVYDEGVTGFNRRQAMSGSNIELVNLLMRCRHKNLLVLIIVPMFYMVEYYLACKRARFLINVSFTLSPDPKDPHPTRRGDFRFYNKQGKVMLYNNKFNKYSDTYPYIKGHSFDGRFTHTGYLITEGREAYEQKKLASYAKKGSDKEAFACFNCGERTQIGYNKKTQVMICRRCGSTWEGKPKHKDKDEAKK